MGNKAVYSRETKATRIALRGDGYFLRYRRANQMVKREMVRARPRKVKPQYCFRLTEVGKLALLVDMYLDFDWQVKSIEQSWAMKMCMRTGWGK